MKVFVSYSRVDREFVDDLKARLASLGYDVWRDLEDMDTMSEDDWREAVVNAIADTDVMVLVLSPASTTSESVEREMTLAKADHKRIVPVLYEPCELHGTFKYVLLNTHYIDFVANDFDRGIEKLTDRLGGTGTPPPDQPVVIDEGDNGVTHGEGPDWRTWGLVAGGIGVLAVVVILAVTLTDGSDPSRQDQAEDLVMAWGDATTARDFTEAERLDPSHPAEFLETLYGGIDDPVRMVSVEPYIAEVSGDGSVWRLRGAAMALDYNPDPSIRTHVICSDWLVDLDAGTATWTTGADEFFEGVEVPPAQFA